MWSFAEYANTVMILKSPLEITRFILGEGSSRFVIAGMLSGQIVLYDTNEIFERKKNDILNTLEEAPILNPLTVSGINDSHKLPVVSLAWMPPRLRIERKNPCLLLPDP